MNEMVEKLREIEVLLSSSKGPFDLFALFLRENSAGFWDLVVSAAWIDADEVTALDEIATLVQQRLATEEVVKLSGVRIVDTKNPGVAAVAQDVHVEHGVAKLRNTTFFDHEIKEAFVITARMPKAA